jgi:hypothetical protein
LDGAGAAGPHRRRIPGPKNRHPFRAIQGDALQACGGSRQAACGLDIVTAMPAANIAVQPTAARLGLKLTLLAGVAGVPTIGNGLPLAGVCVLLAALYCSAAALHFAVGMICRDKLLAAFNHWHEALIFAVAALLSHLAAAGWSG